MAQEAVMATIAEVTNQSAASTAEAPELPNFIHLLHLSFKGNPVIDFLYTYVDQFFVILAVCLIALFFSQACKRRSIIPGRLQMVAEMVVEGLFGLVSGMLGEKEGRRYLPFLGSLFIFIITMNFLGLFPFLKSPTSSFYTTAPLAVCVFIVVQCTAIFRLGPKKYLFHLMGEPDNPIGWIMVILLFPIHVMEEFIKPVSLSCRLFGNLKGEDTLLGVALMMGIFCMAGIDYLIHLPISPYIGLPLHLPFMFLAIITSTIQALVFTLLSTVYIMMVLPHEEHEHEGH